jgi:hypothetical protein
MRMFGFAVAICGALMFGPPALAQSGDVLAPARQGQVQCFVPNVAAKTCQSIGSYAFNANGAIDNVSETLIMPAPLVVMRASAPVTVRNNAICGPLTAADIARATFTIDGRPATEQQTANIRAGLAQQLAPMFDVEMCVSVTAVDGGYRADSTVGGVARPDLAQPVLWVRPEEGYRVAP